MATTNRLKNKRKCIEQSQKHGQQTDIQHSDNQKNNRKIKSQITVKNSTQKQSQYEKYYKLAECNPNGVNSTSKLFPHNYSMLDKFNVPMGFVFSPLLFVENQTKVMQKSADRIPRCVCCRTYMNCYNRVQKNYIVCFFCGNKSAVSEQYNMNQQPNDEITSPIYQAIGPKNFYGVQPPQETFVFLIDIHSESANTKMLYYIIAAMKQVLSRAELDDICIYLFTYDEIVHEYDFSGQQIKCTIIDETIVNEPTRIKLQPNFLKDIRDKLFNALDTLQELCEDNYRKGSNFTKCFQYVINYLQHTKAKYFIFQCNQAITGEKLFWQEGIIKKNQHNKENSQINLKSILQSKNKTFFNMYIQKMIKSQSSLSLYCFARNYKNLRVLHDVFKLSNSELRVYSKDSPSQLQKFYYQFSYFLGATYYRNVVLQLLLGQGWTFTGVYGNFYRRKQSSVVLQLNTVEANKKVYALVYPSKNVQQGSQNPYCALQTIVNYRYKRQSYICISTMIVPITSNIQKLYTSINVQNTITAMARGFMSSLRMETIGTARKKMIDIVSSIYKSVLQVYKKRDEIPDGIMTIIMAVLGMLKAPFSQLEFINNTPILDKVICERNFLQFANSVQLSILFNPYLFDLSHLDESMCCEDPQFIYPPTIVPRFQNIKDSLYLLDNGLYLYLYIGKQCNGQLLKQVFGQGKLTRNDILTQQILMKQSSKMAQQIKLLIKYLREQKSYGWIPLYIVRAGENTLNEKNFYLNFYQEKYQEFRNYKMSVEEFLGMISKGYSVV